MRIGYDISTINRFSAGIGNYALNLMDALGRFDAKNEYLLYSAGRPDPALFAGLNKVRLRGSAFALKASFWLQAALPIKLLLDRVDLFHGTGSVIPLLSRKNMVVTIHDLVPFVMPDAVRRGTRLAMSLIPRSARAARRVIVPSLSTKNDLIRLFGISEEKIAVVHEGVSPVFSAAQDAEAKKTVRAKYALPERFILFVGTIEPRKNIGALLRMLRSLIDAHGIPHELVVVGKHGWGSEKAPETAAALGLSGRVRFLDYVPVCDLPLIYSCAEVFVYPSLYEGFGLPVLEAMASGVPVVTSSTSSLPEIAGDAAVLVDPKDSGALADAVLKLCSDAAFRKDLAQKGALRASSFTWEKAARATLAVYEEAAS